MMFSPRLLNEAPFAPHPYATLKGAFPAESIPEAVYAQMEKKYAMVENVMVSRITYTSDGLAVTGIMALPKEVKKTAHPILIYNRGGNREYGKLTLPQILRTLIPFAQKNYLVFASNYRGNDGGEGTEEFGGADVNDVLNLLEMAKQHSGWDGKSIYMIGHSRGGMMTYLALKHGATVNAAVVIAGMADMEIAIEQRPALEANVFQQIVPGAGDARAQAYRDRSVVQWPEQIKVPVLILHGDKDDKVDVSHAEDAAAAFARAGVPHELVIYPGGNHALVRDWAEVLERMDGWFETHRLHEKEACAS